MILRVEGITPVWQVEAPKYPRNKFCCLARGAESSLLEPRGGNRGRPREDPPRLLVPLEFSTEAPDWKRKSRFPRKRNKILDSSNHLLSPNSSSNIHPSPSLAGCRSSTRLPWPGTRAGRGRGQGRAEGVAFATVAWGTSRAARRAQSRRRHCPPPPPPGPAPDAEAQGSD